ncbi:MAG: ParB N-terminal domain-containing protein [Clostridiales bacterium]|nr:ParB N-terminal domain-containing protein [Clostridiales bacterium]
MKVNREKKTATFASIFGEDYDPNEVIEKDNGSVKLKLDELVPFKDHPFKLYVGDRLNDMVESIKNLGVIVPIVVRKKGLRHEILSGHNRVNAAKEAGLKDILAIIKEGLTEEEAILIVTETNMMQRSFTDLLHSERATVISTRHNAIKKQGVRTDLLKEIEKLSKAPNLADIETSCPVGTKLDSKSEVGKKYDLSSRSVARYLRISKLNTPLKELIDEGKIAMRAGVDLSYLSEENQEIVEAIISENTFKVDMKKASALRVSAKNRKLRWEKAVSIISGEWAKKPRKPAEVKVKREIISKYFKAKESTKTIENVIEKALEMYFAKEKDLGVEEEEVLE